MNFCAALYTPSFLYIFVCASLLIEATQQKLLIELSTLSGSLLIALFFLFPTFSPSPPLLSISFFLSFFLPSLVDLSFSLVSSCRFFLFWLSLSLSLSQLYSCPLHFVILKFLRKTTPMVHYLSKLERESFFAVYKQVVWIFAETNFLVELVWIWSQNESYHFDVGRGGVALHIKWVLVARYDTQDSTPFVSLPLRIYARCPKGSLIF